MILGRWCPSLCGLVLRGEQQRPAKKLGHDLAPQRRLKYGSGAATEKLRFLLGPTTPGGSTASRSWTSFRARLEGYLIGIEHEWRSSGTWILQVFVEEPALLTRSLGPKATISTFLAENISEPSFRYGRYPWHRARGSWQMDDQPGLWSSEWRLLQEKHSWPTVLELLLLYRYLERARLMPGTYRQ